MENEFVIRKIQKLLELGHSSNEAEANLAMARAQELLAKYNLDVAMVKETVVEGGTVAAAPEKREKTKVSRSAQYAWQRQLWKTLAEANFCYHWITKVYEGKRGSGKQSKVPVKRHMVLGRESNVLVVSMMGAYLEDTMERILPYPNSERMSRSALSWKAGCAERLCERINENAERMKRESVNASADSTALVLRDVFQREYTANYDACWGAGAWTRKQIADSQWEAGREERQQQAEAETLRKEKEWLLYLQNETPQQKKEREREDEKKRLREERANARWVNSYHKERARERAKVDGEAYDSGREHAESISLSTQVSDGTVEKERRLR